MEKSGFGNRVFIFTNLMYVYLEVIRTGCVGWCDFPFKNPLSVILSFLKNFTRLAIFTLETGY